MRALVSPLPVLAQEQVLAPVLVAGRPASSLALVVAMGLVVVQRAEAAAWAWRLVVGQARQSCRSHR